jgi:hypothetical protein
VTSDGDQYTQWPHCTTGLKTIERSNGIFVIPSASPHVLRFVNSITAAIVEEFFVALVLQKRSQSSHLTTKRLSAFAIAVSKESFRLESTLVMLEERKKKSELFGVYPVHLMPNEGHSFL